MTCIFNDLICIVLHKSILYKKKTRLTETTFTDIKSKLHSYITIKKITFSLFQYNCIICLQYQHYSYYNVFNIILIFTQFYKNCSGFTVICHYSTVLKCLSVCVSEGSTRSTGPARPTRPLWHPWIRRHWCEYPHPQVCPAGLSQRPSLCWRNTNPVLLPSTAVLPAEVTAKWKHTGTKELCSQQREGSLRRDPRLSPEFVSQ